MKSHEQQFFVRAVGAGFFGAFLGIAALGFAGISFLSVPHVRDLATQELSRFFSLGIPQPLVDSAGSVDPVVSVVAAADPAVVSLVVTKEVPNYVRTYERFSPFGDGFSGFFVPQYEQEGTREEEVAGGTGFFISSDGYLVTNNHVIDIEESSYTAYLNDGTSYEATLIATDALLDIALLKVTAPDASFASLSFGDSDAVQVGQTAIAIGNALGEYRNTVSSGIVSGLSRSVYAETGDGSLELLQDIIQTDAAINSGNSGGPLLDLAGNVIGVNVAASLGAAENIGFAIPANAVLFAVQSMQEHGRVVRPWLGVRYEHITPEYAELQGLDVQYGALVRRGSRGELAVIPGSPADKAGIEENDIILAVDDEAINESRTLGYLLNLHAPGDVVTLTVLHDGNTLEYEVTLAERLSD